MKSISDHIQINYPSLSKTELRIAEYVLEHKQSILNIKIQDLANQIEVSVAAITRFCRKIGVASFVDFKILLRDEVMETAPPSSTVHIIDKYYQEITNTTNSLSDPALFKQAAALIENARSVHLYGIGSSGLTAQEFKLRLTRLGILVDTHTDSHSMIINSSILTEEDVVLVISNSGQTREVIDGIVLARRSKAKIIAITNFSETPLAKQADLLLYTANLNNYYKNGFLNSQLSILYIIDILTNLLAQNERASSSLKNTVDALNEFEKI